MRDAVGRQGQEARYVEASRTFGAALERLAAGYERDTEARRDLLQDIHVAVAQPRALRRSMLAAHVGLSSGAQHRDLARDQATSGGAHSRRDRRGPGLDG